MKFKSYDLRKREMDALLIRSFSLVAWVVHCDTMVVQCDTRLVHCDTRVVECHTRLVQCDTRLVQCDTRVEHGPIDGLVSMCQFDLMVLEPFKGKNPFKPMRSICITYI